MNYKIIVAALLLASAPCAFGSTFSIEPGNIGPDPTIIDFETGSTLLPVVPGVTWLRDSHFPISEWPRGTHWFGSSVGFADPENGSYDPDFGSQFLGNLEGYPGYSDIGLTFDAPVQAVGGWLRSAYCCYAEALEFRVLDSSANLLASRLVLLPFEAAPAPFSFFGFYSTEGISRVEWRLVGDIQQSGGILLDNVTFGAYQAVVPIPPALVLFTNGLAILALVRRRHSLSRI